MCIVKVSRKLTNLVRQSLHDLQSAHSFISFNLLSSALMRIAGVAVGASRKRRADEEDPKKKAAGYIAQLQSVWFKPNLELCRAILSLFYCKQ